MKELENVTEITDSILKKITDLTIENIVLSEKLKIATDALHSLRNKFDKTGTVADNALIEINKVEFRGTQK